MPVIKILTFNAVGLGQLRAVGQQWLANLLPALALWQADVDMCRREVIDVKPDIFLPAMLDQFFVCRLYQYAVGKCSGVNHV